MQNKIAWLHSSPQLPEGIIVGCDEKQEWMLPWWWSHYSVHNTLPVVFVDFGLSTEACHWCEQRGKVLSLSGPLPDLKTREELQREIVAKWEAAYGDGFWKGRKSWFKKPHALLQTPFEKTLWLDIDCEVKADLAPLFSTHSTQIGLVPEPEFAHLFLKKFSLIEQGEICYNSGVVFYRHGSEAILRWAEESLHRADDFWSDQHLLSRQIFEKQTPVSHLSELYNWRMACGKNEDASIVHWVGDMGKEYILLNLHGFIS
ncbi:MAG: hypothetical protein JSS60_06660 [Verrucomicrobia bacterium]|nr:hypothetical protein [Verrucomicrobiota bacterium]